MGQLKILRGVVVVREERREERKVHQPLTHATDKSFDHSHSSYQVFPRLVYEVFFTVWESELPRSGRSRRTRPDLKLKQNIIYSKTNLASQNQLLVRVFNFGPSSPLTMKPNTATSLLLPLQSSFFIFAGPSLGFNNQHQYVQYGTTGQLASVLAWPLVSLDRLMTGLLLLISFDQPRKMVDSLWISCQY